MDRLFILAGPKQEEAEELDLVFAHHRTHLLLINSREQAALQSIDCAVEHNTLQCMKFISPCVSQDAEDEDIEQLVKNRRIEAAEASWNAVSDSQLGHVSECAHIHAQED